MADWRNKLEMIVNKTKAQLFAKGTDNICQLQGTFDAHDADKSGSLNSLEFEKFMNALGVFLARQELRNLYDNFDHDKNGQVSYCEFVNVLKTSMSEARVTMVKHAWSKVAGGQDSCSWECLLSKYNAPQHPRVTSREKRAETVFSDFSCLMGAHASNGNICEAGFLDYYTDCNAVLPNEKENYFVDMLIQTWGLDADKAVVSEARVCEMTDIVFEKVR